MLKLGEKLGLIKKKSKENYSSISVLTQLLFASTHEVYRLLRSYANIPARRIDIEKGHFKNTTDTPNQFYVRVNTLTDKQAREIHSILINAMGEIEQICQKPNPEGDLTTFRLIHFNYFDVRDS